MVTPLAPPYNVARVLVGGVIAEGFYYGFQVTVTNPQTFDTNQQMDWGLWTEDSRGFPLDGTKETVILNPNILTIEGASSAMVNQPVWQKSFGIYNDYSMLLVETIVVNIMNALPYAITKPQQTKVEFYPIHLSVNTDTTLRITAPSGFIWDASNMEQTFEPKTDSTTKDWPSIPNVENDNQLVWPIALPLTGGKVYGFRVRVIVPTTSPVLSSNSWFLEFGYNKPLINDRFMGIMIEAQPVKTVVNTIAILGTNLQGYQGGYMEFQFRTVTDLVEDQVIVIKGLANTAGFIFTCTSAAIARVEGSPKLPYADCVTPPSNDDLPIIVLRVGGIEPIRADNYKITYAVDNPAERSCCPGSWEFGTYNSYPSDYPDGKVDNSMIAEGHQIKKQMLRAAMVTISAEQRIATNRNDQPGEASSVIFYFELLAAPGTQEPLYLRGPRGVQFDQDCTDVVITDHNDVFGLGSGYAFPPQYTRWPVEIISCTGNERTATIILPVGLIKRAKYAFRIGIKANPQRDPDWNKWSIDYATETSYPFDGYRIWTATDTSIGQVTDAASLRTTDPADKTVNPVDLRFRPYNTIPINGVLRVEAPSEYRFVVDPTPLPTRRLDDNSSEYSSSPRNLAVNTNCFDFSLYDTTTSTKFSSSEVNCKIMDLVDPRRILLKLLGGREIEGGKLYSLVVMKNNPYNTNY
jgi:hypothetical protein